MAAVHPIRQEIDLDSGWVATFEIDGRKFKVAFSNKFFKAKDMHLMQFVRRWLDKINFFLDKDLVNMRQIDYQN